MNRLYGAIFYLFFISACTPVQTQNTETLYEKLSSQEQVAVDSVLDEFKRHHFYFLPELSGVLNLTAATARADPESEEGVSAEDSAHDHGSPGDTDYQDEHLDIKITQAYPNKDGQYLTPTIPLTPTKVYTYQTLYTVLIKDKVVSVSATGVEENKAQRVQSTADEAFIVDLAKRLKGKVTAPGVIALP